MTDKKYEFTGETLEHEGRTLKRIKRLSDGELGGWIESEDNLSHLGDSWVGGNAKVYGTAWVYENAEVCDNAKVYGDAWVCGYAKVYDNAKVYGDAHVFEGAEVCGYAKVHGNALVFEDAKVCGYAKVYDNAKVYGDDCIEGDLGGPNDPVNKPDHYTPKEGEIECIAYIEQVLGPEKFIGYCHGNVTKYLHRHTYKGKPVEDLEKAQVYLEWMLKAMKGEKVRP